MSQTMMPGFAADSASYDNPSRAAAPGARFCTTTSASSLISRLRMICASGCFTSSVRLSFERLVQTKCDARPRTRSSYPRAKSPTTGRSILMTRAPRSANCRVAKGAATACSNDTIVSPSRGFMLQFFRFEWRPRRRVLHGREQRRTFEGLGEVQNFCGEFWVARHAPEHLEVLVARDG